MRTIFFLLPILTCGCSVESAKDKLPHKQVRQALDSELILGKWIIVEASRDGAPYPSEVGGTTTFIGRTAVVETTDEIVADYRVQLDQSQSPKHIDWKLEQDGVTMTLSGLYELNGDKLTTCSPANFNSDRPSSIETQSGDGRWLFHLKRAGSEGKCQ